MDKGTTPSERYLARLSERTFLRLWSVTNLYRDQKQGTKGDGKEFADLLVPFGNDYIIFSDKDCDFTDHPDPAVAWKRWKRKAIDESVRQLLGAERWLRQYPNRIFLDRACTTTLPFEPPNRSLLKVHLVAVAHGARQACSNYSSGGSGSLMINTSRQHVCGSIPFTVGDENVDGTFVHILDDVSLDLVLSEFDTTADFVEYLGARSNLLRNRQLISPGEESLVARFIRTKHLSQGIAADLPPDDHVIALMTEGDYEQLRSSPQYRQRATDNLISYTWDRLIENFTTHAQAKTLQFNTGLSETELVLRAMAKENRFSRRLLSQAMYDLINDETGGIRRRMVRVPSNSSVIYCFVTVTDRHSSSQDEYREIRRNDLYAYCLVTASKYASECTEVVGIATEPGISRLTRSEDFCLVCPADLDDDDHRRASDLQMLGGYHGTAVRARGKLSTFEFEQTVEPVNLPYSVASRLFDRDRSTRRISRNVPCPCGSGVKYKRCCGQFV